MANYITIQDVDSDLFSRFSDATKQKYVDKANLECEDLAKRTITGFNIADIKQPIHFKLKDYLCHYAIQQLSLAKIGSDNTDTVEDKYEKSFKRESYVIQKAKGEVTASVFTGIDETPRTRAVFAQRTFRG